MSNLVANPVSVFRIFNCLDQVFVRLGKLEAVNDDDLLRYLQFGQGVALMKFEQRINSSEGLT